LEYLASLPGANDISILIGNCLLGISRDSYLLFCPDTNDARGIRYGRGVVRRMQSTKRRYFIAGISGLVSKDDAAS
jgi:hypothetical protein